MRIPILIILSIFTSFQTFSQAREEDEARTINVILIVKNGEVMNTFIEGMGITAKIDGKVVNGKWYFKAEPDIVTIVNNRGEVIGEVKLNEQKSIKLETDEPQSSGGGLSFGIGFGPVGIETGSGGGGPRFVNYNMSKNQAVFDKKKETRAERIKREYNEKKAFEKQQKEAKRQAKKSKKKNK